MSLSLSQELRTLQTIFRDTSNALLRERETTAQLRAEVAALREWQASASKLLRGHMLGPSRNMGGSEPFCLVCKLWPHNPVCPMETLLAPPRYK